MPETKKTTAPVGPVDAWDTPQDTWLYVVVPDEDPLGKPYPSIRLNKHEFARGQTYKVPPQVAAYVNDRIKVFNKSCVRLLQPDMAQDGIVRTADGASAPMPTL